MGNFAVLLIATFIPSICSAVDILQPSDEVCLGAPVTLTCTVNGTNLGWRYGGVSGETDTYFAPSGSTSNRLLGSGPFNTRVTSVSSGIITSIASTSNLTRDANGLTLECSDGLFVSGVEIDIVTLPFQDPSAVQVTFEEPIGNSLSELIIHFCWPKAVCAPSYRVNIMRDGQPLREDITNDICYFYNAPDIGTYTMYVNSIDYFGVMTGQPANTTVHIRRPDILVNSSFDYASNIISVIIQDSTDNQLPITSCNIRLTSDDGSYFDDANCTQDRLVGFYNAVCGRSYTYNVTISNVVNSTITTGVINAVCIKPSTTTLTVYVTTSFCSMTPSCTPMTPCPPQKLPLWALILIIALSVLFVSAVTFIILELWWRLRCCNLECWDSLLWTYLFCDCLKNCCPKDKRVNTTNLRTKSPDEKETTTF